MKVKLIDGGIVHKGKAVREGKTIEDSEKFCNSLIARGKASKNLKAKVVSEGGVADSVESEDDK